MSFLDHHEQLLLMPNLERAMVYKSNSLVEACYRLSVIEQRIVLACISQVRRDEPITDEIMYSVTATDIAEVSENDIKTTYRDLQEGALRLKRREVRIEKEANGNTKRKQVLICGWVQSIMYIESEGRVCLRFNKDMLPYLTELSAQFTKYRLKAVAKMDSSYAIRLYELLIQWRDIHEREVSVQWLRETFQLGDKYSAIKDLKKRVIDPAVAQINEHSDLTVSYAQRKSGRNVTHLTFSFQPKEEPKPNKTKAAQAQPPELTQLDEGRAKMAALVIEFLTHNETYKRRYPNIPPEKAWHVEGIRNEFMPEFEAWRSNTA